MTEWDKIFKLYITEKRVTIHYSECPKVNEKNNNNS